MKIEEAVKYMKDKHKYQERKQGTPYYLHPLSVSKYLKDKGFNEEYQICALFHDLLEDTNTTYDEIKSITSKNIADVVKLVTKEKNYQMQEYVNRIKNNNIALAVKLADRIHNLSEAKLAPNDFRIKYIKETEKWYVDMAKNTMFENDLNKNLLYLKNIAQVV